MKKLKPLLISIYIKIKINTPKKYQHMFENFLIDQGFKSWTGFPAHLTTYGIKK